VEATDTLPPPAASVLFLAAAHTSGQRSAVELHSPRLASCSHVPVCVSSAGGAGGGGVATQTAHMLGHISLPADVPHSSACSPRCSNSAHSWSSAAPWARRLPLSTTPGPCVETAAAAAPLWLARASRLQLAARTHHTTAIAGLPPASCLALLMPRSQGRVRARLLAAAIAAAASDD